MPKFRLSRKAENDLMEIWLYSAETWSESQANKYIREIKAGVEDICTYPLLNKRCFHPFQQYRRKKLNSHVIFYRVEPGSGIEIVRILHQKMDIGSKLGES